jgi:hypothetical protein
LTRESARINANKSQNICEIVEFTQSKSDIRVNSRRFAGRKFYPELIYYWQKF